MVCEEKINSGNVKHSYYYSANMSRTEVLPPPVQPKREERLFLEYAEKPALEPTPIISDKDEQGEPFSIGVEVLPIGDVIPRYHIENINFDSLQLWLKHLGQAIYNPLFIVQTPDGEYYSTRDGDHRSRCLWEIGEPEIRVVVRKASSTALSGVKRIKWRQWIHSYLPMVTSKPATPYMFGEPRKNWMRVFRRYYPPLWQPSQTLQDYFNEPKNDGKYFKDTLFNRHSFREIYAQWQQTGYRLDVIDKILENVDVENKTVLDVGCFYGWASFMLLEAGAKSAVAIDVKQHKLDVVKHIAGTRAYPVKTYCVDIQQFQHMLGGFDVILLLNVFHHILHQTDEAWNILNKLVQKCGVLFLMMGAKPQWGILQEWENDVEKALKANIDGEVTPLLKTGYRNRVLYKVQGKGFGSDFTEWATQKNCLRCGNPIEATVCQACRRKIREYVCPKCGFHNPNPQYRGGKQ